MTNASPDSADRIHTLEVMGDAMIAFIKKLDQVRLSAPPDTATGDHVLGKLALFTNGNGTGAVTAEGNIVVAMGLVGLKDVHHFELSKPEARALAMAILNAGA